MTFRELVVPSALEVLECVGVEPVAPEPGSTVQELTFEADGRNSVSFSYDVIGRSVRVIWKAGDRTILDIFREGAVRIEFRQDGDDTVVDADFETDSLGGNIEVRVGGEVQVKDKLLFV
ncbi:hypothetical protein [Amycolatopsis australiensis]|uniref:Uncharacterized protein n=1 Tax=Amycolatopsis australiensis TaxID=546364 RepID=A0A1K1SS10_9PSEU|nr:hypothetical protein [Amycolatopsis australiensis]SFW86871.1 hypothetical protein SAMN04489730_6524 [Amycolatopsis australiensis]